MKHNLYIELITATLKGFFFTEEEVIAEYTCGTYITIFYWDLKANRKKQGCSSCCWKANEFSFWLFCDKVQQSVMKLEGIARTVSGIQSWNPHINNGEKGDVFLQIDSAIFWHNLCHLKGQSGVWCLVPGSFGILVLEYPLAHSLTD